MALTISIINFMNISKCRKVGNEEQIVEQLNSASFMSALQHGFVRILVIECLIPLRWRAVTAAMPLFEGFIFGLLPIAIGEGVRVTSGCPIVC